MGEQDYVLRLIAQLAAIVRRLIVHLGAGRTEEAASLIAETAEMLGLDPELALRLPESEVVALVRQNPDRALALGTLLRFRAEIAALKQGDRQALAARLLALRLHALALHVDATLRRPEWHTALDVLQRTAGATIAAPLLVDLALLHEQCSAFSRAEDTLIALAALEPARAIELAGAFYTRLSKLSERTLENGGLPRDEHADGIAAIRAAARG